MPVKKKKPARRQNKAKPGFDQPKEVRAIARERVGTVKASRVIVPKAERPKLDRKAKHKIPIEQEEQ
jgi:hypothetical protein